MTPLLSPAVVFAGELPELFHFLGDVAQEIIFRTMTLPERDALDWVHPDKSVVLRCPLEVSEEPATDRMNSTLKLVLAPEVDVHGNESTVHPLEVCECLCRDDAVPFLEHDQEIDVAPVVLRALQHTSQENSSYKPVLAWEPGSVRLSKRRERIHVRDVMAAHCLRQEYFRHGVSRRVW